MYSDIFEKLTDDDGYVLKLKTCYLCDKSGIPHILKLAKNGFLIKNNPNLVIITFPRDILNQHLRLNISLIEALYIQISLAT